MAKRLLALAVVLSALVPLEARAEEAVPPELQEISIVDRAGQRVPGDIELTRQDGQRVRFEQYLEGDMPLVVVLAYYRCPMLCTLVVNGLTDGLKELPWGAGERFKVLVVSFDPRDTVAIAREKRENYLREYGRPVQADGFDFLVGNEDQVRRLADALGFRYRWDTKTEQYAHAAGAFVVTPGGTISRTLYGITFPGKDLKLALVEASKGAIGSAWDRVILFCYHYDADARGYVLAATRLMSAGGIGTVLILSVVLARFWRKERQGPVEQRAT